MRTLIVEKDKLEENTRKLKEHTTAQTKIIAVVKCNGYGLGAVKITKCLIENGIEMFAVSTVEEALELRNAGIKNDILMLSCTAIREDVYINDKICEFSTPMDEESHEDDLNKKALLALANEMGYEATFLFEEMAERLYEILDEEDED